MAGLAGGYSSLQRLSLVRCGNITGLESLLQRAPNLREISIDTCNIAADASFGELSLPKVQSLKLANIYSFGILVSILHCSPQLEEIALQSAQSTDNCLEQVSQHAQHLRRLALWHCTLLTDTAIANLARHCPALRDLKLGLCTSLTDQAVITFTENCPLLESVTLNNSSQTLTDASLTAIATQCGPRLRCLSITLLGGEQSLNALRTNCPNLHSLKVGYLLVPVPDVLGRLISSMTQLEELALQCSLSDDVLNAVASHGAQLRHLDLTGSQNFTSVGLANVALHCTKLKTLYLSHNWEFSKGMCTLWGRLNPEICFNAPNWTTPPYWNWEL
eukprot:gene30668-34613_t